MSRGHQEIRLNEQIRTLFQSGSLGGLADGQLLDRYASGDVEIAEAAFAALVERHGSMVLGVCSRLLADAHLAEDAFQATFLVLARRAASVRNRDSVGGWLHRVARRIAMRLRRKVGHRMTREKPAAGEVAVEHPDRVERDELRRVIDHEIDRLGEAQRLPVILCCLQGVSHEEASQRLHWPLGTLKSRLARGKRRLQERLVRRGFAPAAALAVGSGLFATETSAAVPPALVETTARAAAAIGAGGVTTGVVPAALSELVREELGSMLATKIKLATGAVILAAGASAVLIGVVLGGGPGRTPEAGPLVAAVSQRSDQPKIAADAPAPVAPLSAQGTVVDSNGQPIAGARVILREWSVYRMSEMPQEQSQKIIKGQGINDTLAETRTDQAGRFRFHDVAARPFPKMAEVGQSVFPWDIVALAPGHGLAWAPLTQRNQRDPVTLKLGPEGTLRCRIIEPGGKPVAGAKVQVFGIDPLGRPDASGLHTENRLNLSWSAFPLGAITAADGHFTVSGLPRDQVISLVVTERAHERLYVFAATSDEPQPDLVSQSVLHGKSTETRMPVHTGEFTLTANVADHVLLGQVVRQADGKPAAKAVVLHGGFAINADENGRFRIDGLVSGTLELNVGPAISDSAAAAIAAQVEIPENPREIQHTFTLPPGLVLSGRVIDAATGAGVEKALVDFNPKYNADETPTGFGFSDETDASGRFRMVVPPGRGTVVLRTFPVTFPQPERKYTGEPEEPRFAREVEGHGGETIEIADFKLTRGRQVVLRIVDAGGRPLAGSRIDIHDPNRGFNTAPGRADAQGRYLVVGLAPDQSTIVDIIDAQGTLGATVEIPGAGSAGAKDGEMEVRLGPLLSLSGRVLDEDGKPIKGAVIHVYRDVNYPGQNSRSFGTPVATLNLVTDDGTYKFDQLIAGATYNTQVEVGGYPNAMSNQVTVKAGQPVRIDDFRLPAVDQEVQGVVVDPRGKALAGIMVSIERSGRTGSLYAPAGGVWFQETDAAGRFHLTSLPRGPIRLMVYRNPTGAFRQIQNIKYAEVRPGEAEVRIELPDADDRLRGVE